MEVALALIVFSMLGAVAIGLSVRIVPASERAWLVRVLMVSLALRLLVALTFDLFPSLRIFHEDADGYEYFGMQLSEWWHHTGPPVVALDRFTQNYGYYYVAAAIYYLIPISASAPFANAIVGTITVLLVYRLAREFFHPIVAKRAAVLTAFFPSMILWSSIALKDSLVSFLIVLALLSCIFLKERFSIGALLGTVVPVVALQPIRFYMIYFVVFAILVALVTERGLGSLSGVYKQLAIAGAIVGLLVVMGVAGRVAEGTSFLTLEKVSAFRRGMALTANSGFAGDTDLSTPLAAISFLPIGMATLLWAPFPWQMVSLRALFAAPETIAWWFMFPALVRGSWFCVKHRWREASPLLIFAVTLTAGYSLVHGNVGSGFRQRAQVFVFLFVLAALGHYRRAAKRAHIDEMLLLEGGLGERRA